MFEIESSDSSFIKRLKNEANQAIEFHKDNGENNKVADIETATQLLINLAHHSEYFTDTNRIIGIMSKFIQTGLFSPLTLKEGEFIYTRPGLSVNRRFNRIQQDLVGIFDSEAYLINPIEYYDIINNINTIDEYLCKYDEEASNEPDRVYLSTGGLITDVYFTRAYIKEIDIQEHKYIPRKSFAANICRVIVNKKYINVLMITDSCFKNLNSHYDLNYARDNNDNNICFGITKNIQLNGLRTKRSTL